MKEIELGDVQAVFADIIWVHSGREKSLSCFDEKGFKAKHPLLSFMRMLYFSEGGLDSIEWLY